MTSPPQSTTLTLYGWEPHSSVVAQLLRSPAISRDLPRSRAISCDLPRSPEIWQSEVAPLAPSQRFRAGPPPGGNPPSSSDQLPSQSLPASLSFVLLFCSQTCRPTLRFLLPPTRTSDGTETLSRSANLSVRFAHAPDWSRLVRCLVRAVCMHSSLVIPIW